VLFNASQIENFEGFKLSTNKTCSKSKGRTCM